MNLQLTLFYLETISHFLILATYTAVVFLFVCGWLRGHDCRDLNFLYWSSFVTIVVSTLVHGIDIERNADVFYIESVSLGGRSPYIY